METGRPATTTNESDVTTADKDKTMQFDDDTLKAIAEVYKDEGNNEYRKGDFNNPIYFYTEGIKVNCKNKELNAKLYSNRAAAHYSLGNYTETLNDAEIVTGLQPSFLKVFIRGASTCVQLSRFDEAIKWCNRGLAIDSNNQKLLELRSRSVEEQKKLQDNQKRKELRTTGVATIDRHGNTRNIASHIQPGVKQDIDYFEGCLKNAKQVGDRAAECSACDRLGQAYQQLGNFKRAIEYFEQSLKVAKELGHKAAEGEAYGNLGIAHDKLGDFITAIRYHECCLKIVRELSIRSAEGLEFGHLGNNFSSVRDFKRAIICYEGFLKISKELGNKSGEGKVYCCLGSAHLRLGNLKTAKDYHERHLKNVRKLDDKWGEAIACGNLGNVYLSVGNFKTAIELDKRRLAIAIELGNRSEEGNACGNLGRAYKGQGDFKTAIDYHERELKVAKDLGDISKEGTARGNLGIVHHKLGNFKTAIDNHERHLKISKELGDTYGVGYAYGNLGNVHSSFGDFKTATFCYELNLAIMKELGDRAGEGKAYCNLGNVNHSLGDFIAAKYYHKRHLESAKELSDKQGEGLAFGNLGSDHLRLGDFKVAIDYYERRLKIAKELGDRPGEGAAYGTLGNAYQRMGDFISAINYYELRLEIAKELGERSEEATAYGNLGVAYQSVGDVTKSVSCHQFHLKIAQELTDKKGEADAYGNLGNLNFSLGDLKTAIDYHQLCLKALKELGDRSGEGGAYWNISNVFYKLGDLKTAKDYYERHLEIARKSGDRSGEGIAYGNLGTLFESSGKVQEALKYYQLSMSMLNNLRDRLEHNDDWKMSLRDTYQATYTRFWRLLLEQGKVMDALIAAEQGRAQGLKDLMAFNYFFETIDVEPGKEGEDIQELLNDLPSNTIFIATGKTELIFWVCQDGKVVELRRKEIDSTNKISSFLQYLVEVMGQEIGATDYVNCEDRSFGEERFQRLAVKSTPRGDRLTQSFTTKKSALSILYDTIVVPILDLFVCSELVFVPEGSLCLAPFAAFKTPNSQYLCESYNIRVVPSLTSLKMIKDCPDDYHCRSGALLVGDPWVQDVNKLPPLSFAREEVEMIGRLLGGTPLIGRQATKDEVLRRIGSVALVHIAAHGSMETGEIALAPNPGETDFIMTMKDVLLAKIRARLVVLSCCHSAHGKIKAEGVVGIARAFLCAGARSVLVSLWAIDDKATLEFMKNSYQHLVEGKSASKALNQTMNCMRESDEFSDVKHWAPFVLIGDDVKLEFGGSE